MPTAKFTLHLRWFVAVLSMPVIGSVVPIRAADQNQAPQQVTRSVPPVDKTTKIEISSPSGWWIRIFPNSDGVLAGASSFEWGVTFPVEAFDFEQLYRTVLKNAVASGRDQTHYSIHFFGGDDPGYGSVASLDEKNILAIFQRAKSCAYRSMIPRHFEKAWKERGPRLSKLGEQRNHPGKAASARNDSVDRADLLTRAQRFRKIEAQVDSVWVFERRWRRQIFPKLEEQQHPLAKRVDQWIRQDKGLWARRMTFNECRQFVDRTLPAEEREKSIFYGSVANLKQEGTCWILHTVSAEVADECIAFLDDAGKVLLVWYATDMKFHPPTKGIDSSRIERMPPPGPEKRNGDRSTKTDSATDFRRIQGAWKTIPRTSNVDGKDTDVRDLATSSPLD